MSDLEVFLAMLARAGIEFERRDDGEDVYLTFTAQKGANVVGYIGFQIDVAFEDGRLSTIGAWE